MRFFIVDNNNERIFASKSFKSIKEFSKWFANNVFMFSNRLNFMLGLTPIEIYYNYKTRYVSIRNKETKEWIYKGE